MIAIPVGRRGFTAGIVLLLLVAFVARIHTLADRPLWFDEAMEFWVATAPADELLATVKTALRDPPLYSALLHFWMRLGRDEFVLRLPSTFFSMMSVAAMFNLGRRLHGRRAGAVAALLLALSPASIRQAQEMGQYAMLLPALVVHLLALTLAVATNRWRCWLAWAIAAAVAGHSHNGSTIVILPIAAVTFAGLAWRRNWPAARRLAAALAVYALALAPLIVGWYPAQIPKGATSMAFAPDLHSLGQEIGWFGTSTVSVLSYQLTGYLAEPANWAALRWAAVALVAIALIAVLVRSGPRRRPVVWLAAGWLAYYLAGRWGAYPYGGTRHALILLPLFVAIMALGVARLWRRHWAAGSAMLLALLATMLLAPVESQQDLRTVVAYWLANRGDTPTYVYYGAVPGFRYQLQLHDPAVREVPPLWYSDCWADAAAAYCGRDNVRYGRWLRDLPADEKVAAIRAQLEMPDEPYWLIVAHATLVEERELLRALRQRYEIADRINAVGASAYLLQPWPPA